MNDDSMVKIMQALDLDYSKAIFSTMHFGQSIESLNKQLASMKSIAMQSAKDINTAFASQLGQFASNKTIVDQYGNSLITVGNMSESTREKTDKLTSAQRKQSQTIQDIIKQYKAGVVDAQKFVEVASSLKTSQDQWASLPNQLQKDQISLYSQLNKAENEHRKTLNEKSKILKALNQEHKTTVQEVKQSTLESMKAQASSVQQRVTTKGLSDEYSKQAVTLREQLSALQAKLQLKGRLSDEETKQTQQLKEQLDILQAQVRTDTSDKLRKNPDWLNDEFQRRASWFLTGTMFYGAINGAKDASQAIKDVEMGMVEVQRVMTDSSFVFDDYRDNLFKLAIGYGQVFDNVQQIALRWAQSGYNVADSLELTETSLLALNTAELDATQATEAMIGIMAQWQLQAEDMALVMDKINITADRHSVTSQDLVDGLLRSSGAARIMNLSLEQTIGLLTVMREASGRTGQEVGNALNSILSYIQRPGSIKTLEGLGIQVFADAAKTQFRNVLDIFKDIAVNWNTLSADIQDGFVKSADDAELFNEELANALGMQQEWNDLQQRDISQAAAGVYRRNYFIGMIERLANVQGVLNNMMDAEGYSMRENAKTMETLEKKQQSLQASAEALAVAAGDAGLAGSFKALADGGTSALGIINSMPKEMKDLVMATTSTFLAVKTLQMGMKTFGIELPGISQMITSLTSGTWSLTAALKAGGAGIATFAKANAPLLALSAAIGVIVAVTNAIKKEREERERYIEVTKDNIKSLDEQKRGLQELYIEYNTLKEKEKNLTANADEKARLRDIQRELVDLYGVSIAGIDAEGQAYTNSTNAIRERIRALEEEKALEEAKLETAVFERDVQDVQNLEKNLKKREQLTKDILEIQKQIDEYTSVLLNKGTYDVVSEYGSFTIDASSESDAKLLRDYIANTSRDKIALQNELNSINTTISDASKDRQQLLQTDATSIVKQLNENGVVVSDSARAYATELAKGLSQAPRNIFELSDELEEAIKAFTSSDFEEWSEKYQKAIASNDTKGIDEASNAINQLVRTFTAGKPHLENFVLAMEGAFANSKALQDTTKSTIDLKTTLGNMGVAAKKAFDDLKTLNQAIYDVKNGQALSADTILDLIEKYNLSTDAIKQTTKGYTVEVSALENLRKAKIQTALDGIEAEKRQAEAVRDQVLARLESYGLEIEQLKNLAAVRAALEQQAHRKGLESMAYNDSKNAYDEGYNSYIAGAMNDIRLAQGVLSKIEEIEKRSKLLTGMLNDRNYGISKLKKDEYKAESDRYAEINREIEANNTLLSKNKTLQALAGNDLAIKIPLMQKQITLEREHQDLLHSKANIYRQELKELEKTLSSQGFKFSGSGDNRIITNLENIKSKTKEVEDQFKRYMELQSNLIPKVSQDWLNLEKSINDVGLSMEEAIRKSARELIELEKRTAYMDLEARQRIAKEQLDRAKSKMEKDVSEIQGWIDALQAEIDDIQESERIRQESMERSKRLEEISKLQDKYYYLQHKNLANITEEQAKLVGLEKEREQYLERQTKIQELQIRLDNIRKQKNIQQLTKNKDGTFDYTYVADEKEIENINKQIEDLQKEHSKSLKDLKETTLEDLRKAQEDYDEWEKQNDIRRQIEAKQRRIKKYQDEIKDLQDKYTEQEKLTNEAFAREKENLDRHYMDMDLLTEEAMKKLHDTFGENWVNIYDTLTAFFGQIANEYDALVKKLSTPLPTPTYSSGGQGFYTPPSLSGGRIGTSSDWSSMYFEAREKGDWQTMEYANKQANKERGLGDIVTATTDIEEIKKKYGFFLGGETEMTGLHWVDGKLGEPERILSAQQTKDFNTMVASLPNLLEGIETIGIVSDNVKSNKESKTTQRSVNSGGDTIYYINELTVPDVTDFESFIKGFTQEINNFPNKVTMKVKKIGNI